MTDRLELTWPNKDRFLLSPRDADGKPVWVERTHPGAVEVRGHEFTSEYGEVGADPYADNLLITGDSYDALLMLCEVPEFRRHYRGKVKLVYIDPPFNTGQTFEHYDDWLDHSTWLSFMTERLRLLRDLLAPDGSIWVHLDDTEVHRMRCVLDEVFGPNKFVNSIIWSYKTYQGAVKDFFPRKHDTILWYNKSIRPRFRLPYRDNVRETVAFDRWRNFLNENYEITGANFPRTDSRFMAYYERWVRDHGRDPAPDDVILALTGEVVTDVWNDIPAIDPKDKSNRLGYSTQKPEGIAHRIIEAATDAGDVVLDCFAGSGTTPAVAHKLGRRWIGVDISDEAIEAFVEPRLIRVVDGTDQSGVTAAVGWNGGGGFRRLSVLPSVYDLGPGGTPVLAVDSGDQQIARAVAGQLGFEVIADPPFIGRRGRMRLAYVPGAVGSEDVVELSGCLGGDERLIVVAMVVLEGADRALAEVSPGSRVLKLPRDVLTPRRRRGADR